MSAPEPQSDREARLDEIIADYLDAVEAGKALPEAELLSLYPEFAGDLAEFLDADRKLAGGRLSRDQGPDQIRSLANYEVLEVIGRGGMGIVYKARQNGLDRVVAVKTILGGHLATQSDVRRFRREARCGAKLRHPNIVTIHEVGEHNGLHFFSMEYIEGRSLAELTAAGPLPAPRAADYLKQIARAIHYAHEQQVLHRDLKPSNVLIDLSDRPRVTDFGLARLLTQESTHTAPGTLLGTLSYMSPEQAEGRHADVDERSDVYSLGAVLYEAITGNPPCRGETPVETLAQVLNMPPVPPRLVTPAVPVDLEAICLKCLEKDSRKRYESASDLADDLDRFLSGEPVVATGYDRIWRRLRTAAARLKIRTAKIGLFAGLLIAVTIGWGPRLWPSLSLAPGRPELNTMASVAALMVVWWLTEAISPTATAFLPLILFPLLGIMPAAETSRPYLDDAIILFLGGFLISVALEESGLIRRLAFRMLAWVGDNPRRIVLGFMGATAGISMWVSNTAAAVMMLPIALSVLSKVEETAERSTRSKNLGIALILGIGYAATIGGTATLVGTLANSRFVELFKSSVGPTSIATFLGWMTMGVPLMLSMGFVTWALLVYRLFPVGSKPLLGAGVVIKELEKLGPMRADELKMLLISLLTVMLWIFREPVSGWGWAPFLGLAGRITDGAIAMAMALVCFVLPAAGEPGKRLLEWESTKRLPWGVLFLFGGGLALAHGMQAAKLDIYLGIKLASILDFSPFGTLIGTTTFVAGLTQVIPNVAAVETSFPIISQVASQLSLNPRPLLVASFVAATCSFLLPVSTPPNAIVYGSGKVTIRDMIKAGLWLIPIGIVIAIVIGSLFGA